MDKLMAKLGTMPRILCWKCRKLTPFELDRCQHCGAEFAGATGGAYEAGRVSAPHTAPPPKASRGPPKRTLTEIVEDLRGVRDLSASRPGRPREKELSVRLYQCPACGRFVSEQATECVCGVRFAPMSEVTFACPECASRLPSDVDVCPVCGVGFEPSGGSSGYVYACPRCGVHVSSDAVRCSCGVWFED
jgi:RNA polymerase subunit RPABC4/transcription elongation factor Spt4